MFFSLYSGSIGNYGSIMPEKIKIGLEIRGLPNTDERIRSVKTVLQSARSVKTFIL